MDHAHQLTTVSPPFGSAADAAPFCLGSAQNLTQCPTLGCRGSSGPRHGWAKDGTVRPSPSVPAKRPLAVAAAAGIAFPASRAGTQVLSMASGSRRDDGADGADEGPMAAALDAADRRLANNAATSSQCRVAWWNCQIARPSPFRVRIAADWRGGLGRVTSGLPATTRAQCPPANRDRSRTAKLAPLRSGLRGDSGPTTLPSEQALSSTCRPCLFCPRPQAPALVPRPLECTLYSHRNTPSIPRPHSSPSPLALDARPS